MASRSIRVERALAEACDQLLLFGAPGRKRDRNDVSRFLTGVEEHARKAGLRVVLDSGPVTDVPERASALTAAGQRAALFGITGVTQALFAVAASGALTDDGVLLIALTGEDLAAVSPLLTAVPRIDPRRVEISELAVSELVRLLREDGAGPRVTLVEPQWIDG